MKNLNSLTVHFPMSKNLKLKDSKDENSKYSKPCINIIDGIKCNGKWFQYKAKEDNGYCKACIKNQLKKDNGVKVNKYRNVIYDCKTEGC